MKQVEVHTSTDISRFRFASHDTLRDLVHGQIALARSLDPKLRILAGDIDAQSADRQIEALFSRYPEPAGRPDLFGVPVGVKDIFRVDGVAIRCGSRLPPDLFSGPEALCVRMLREAGAIILAQTATTEFASFEPAATRNPHNPAHTPGGSSSGSAAGVAAGVFPLALGSQTVGSIIRPASYCGVVGVKPSHGTIPTNGLVSFSPTVDQVGFFCRELSDVAPVMKVFDSRWSAESRPETLRVGVPEGSYIAQVPAATMEWFRQVLNRLGSGGCEIQWVRCLGDIADIASRHTDLISAEFAKEQSRWFEGHERLYTQGIRDIVERGRRISGERLAEGRASCATLRRELGRIMDERDLDLWVCPSTLGEAPEGLHSTGSPVMNLPWTHAGMPAISLPCGTGRMGLPMGLQCVGRFGDDHHLVDAVLILDNLLNTGSAR